MFHMKQRQMKAILYSLLPSSLSTTDPLSLGSVVVENAREIYKYIGPSDVVSRETQKCIKIRDKFHVKH